MKTLIILLCIYFAGIVSLPCQDSIGVETQCEAQDNCNDKSDGQNECQPFCNCVCCSSVFIEQLVFLVESMPIGKEIIPFNFVAETSSKFLPSIWQPPKLG